MFNFETDRLILRRFTPDDWEDLYEYLSVEDVLKYLPEWECTKETCKALSAERAQGDTYWAICLKNTGKMIGHIELHKEFNPAFFIYEIGYVFNPKYKHKGYATEACRRIIQYGFEDLNAHRIIATTDPENVASWKLMERLNMRREAHFIQCLYLRKSVNNQPVNWRDEYFYAILQNEWKQGK